jgi:hypothetical protein
VRAGERVGSVRPRHCSDWWRRRQERPTGREACAPADRDKRCTGPVGESGTPRNAHSRWLDVGAWEDSTLPADAVLRASIKESVYFVMIRTSSRRIISVSILVCVLRARVLRFGCHLSMEPSPWYIVSS